MQSNGEASGPAAAFRPAGDFVHQALIYGSDQELLDVALPFVEDALAEEEPALVAVQERHLDNLRGALNGTPPGLTLFSAEQWYDTSARSRDKFARWVNDHLDGSGTRRTRVIGEPPWAIGHEAQIRDWARYESVVNVAFESMPVSFICSYDAGALPDDVIGHARSTHPEIVDSDGIAQSAVYEDPIEFCRRLDDQVERPAGEPVMRANFELDDLPAVRRLIASTATATGLTRARADELVLAVNEIATNALVHGRPPATLRIWKGDGELVCEVSDTGNGITQDLPGQLTPPTEGLGGRGIWLARMLCDAVEVRNGAECSVSMHANTPSSALAD
jgi:anti-sigma regulatory factor (Ser/Thr protein kinase)